MALIELKSNLSAKPDYNQADLENPKQINAMENHIKFRPDEDQLISKTIGRRYRGTKLDGGFLRGGAALQTERTGEDAVRIGKFLFSGKGALFTAKQLILQKNNPLPYTDIYDPTSILRNLPMPAHFNRHVNESNFSSGLTLRGVFQQLTGREQRNEYEKFIENGQFGPDSLRKNYADVQYAVNYLNQKGKKSIQVEYGEQPNLDTLPKDFIKFRIHDLVQDKYIIFPVILTSDIVDNSQASYEEINYIGRPDAVHIYKSVKRSFTIAFKVVATNKEDLHIMWNKVDRLKGLTQPAFKPFLNQANKITGDTSTDIFTRPTAPIITLTLGDVYREVTGYFESVSVTIPNSSTWELEDGSQWPHICDVSCNFTYIGNVTPTIESKNYGVQVPKAIPQSAKEENASSKEADSEQQGIDKLSFGQAFSQKRRELGEGKTFVWRGNSYTTNQA